MAAIRSAACMEKEYTVLCGAMIDEFRITFFFGPEAAPDRLGVVRCVFNVKKRSWKGGVQVTVELAAAQLERIRDRGQFGELIEMIRAKVEPEMFAEYELRARDLFTQRSEEHTSELQSPCNLVCRLLLEKKKNERKCNALD